MLVVQLGYPFFLEKFIDRYYDNGFENANYYITYLNLNSLLKLLSIIKYNRGTLIII